MRVLLSGLLFSSLNVGYALNGFEINFTKVSPVLYEKWKQNQHEALLQIDQEYKKRKTSLQPFVVMISGAPKTGKTTLLEGLHFHFKYKLAIDVKPVLYHLEEHGEIKDPVKINKILMDPFVLLDDSFINFDYLEALDLFRIMFMSYQEDLRAKFLSLPEHKLKKIKAHCCFVNLKEENSDLGSLSRFPTIPLPLSSAEEEEKMRLLNLIKMLKTPVDLHKKQSREQDKKNESFGKMIRSRNNIKEQATLALAPAEQGENIVADHNQQVNLTYEKIYNHVTKTIKKQDLAVKKISNILMSHKNFMEGKYFQNARVLLHGPSGSGKTMIVSKIAETIDMPFFTINASSLTGAGYKGQNLGDQLEIIIDECERKNINPHQVIIFFDEIDKLFSQHLSEGTTPGNVLNELLIFMEKGIVEKRGAGLQERMYEMCTKNSAIFFAGAFHQVNLFQAQKAYPEFFGRIRALVKINSLKDKDFCDILLTSNESPYVVMKEKLEKEGRTLTLDPDALSYLGKYAVKKGTGARAIQYAFNELLVPYFGEKSNEKDIRLTLKDCKDLFDEFMNDDSDQLPRGMYI